MNDAELGSSIERSVARHVTEITTRPNAQQLLTRVERRNVRQRRWLLAIAALVLAVGGLGGYLVGDSGGSSGAGTSVAAVSDGTPPSTAADAPQVAPGDPEAARVEITQAFHDVFDGSIPERATERAMQDAAAVLQLRRDSIAFAEAHGLTAGQLAGATITVLEVNFIDETHAAVNFTLTIPGRGNVIVDKVGYAVIDSGRWKVALRTSCDLLSLDGLIGPCPPKT
jgi:hypothetical protein